MRYSATFHPKPDRNQMGYSRTKVRRTQTKQSAGRGTDLGVCVCVCVKSTEAPQRAAASAAGRQLSSACEPPRAARRAWPRESGKRLPSPLTESRCCRRCPWPSLRCLGVRRRPCTPSRGRAAVRLAAPPDAMRSVITGRALSVITLRRARACRARACGDRAVAAGRGWRL